MNVLSKTLIGAKRVRFILDKEDGLTRNYDGTRCLVLFSSENYDSIFNRIRYLIVVKIGISYIDCHDYAQIKIYSDDD